MLWLILALAGAAAASLSAAHENVVAESSPDALYVVLLRHGDPLARDDGIVHDMRAGNNRILGVVGADAVAQLTADNPDAVVAPSQPVTVESTIWNLERIATHDWWHQNVNWPGPANGGAGVHAYVIDSGIDAAHPEFGGRVVNTFSASNGDYVDHCGHGTHVAGTLGGATHGVARGVTLHAVKVIDGRECAGSTLALASGISHVVTHAKGQRAVINLSLGFAGFDAVIAVLIEQLISDGHAVIAAAGNSGQAACRHYPAAYPGVVAVGASDASDVLAAFSNFGACVDISAPGVAISSAKAYTDTFTLMSGTSMASPHVAGVVSLMMQHSVQVNVPLVIRAMQTGASQGYLTNLRGTPNSLLYWAPRPAAGLLAMSSAPCVGAWLGLMVALVAVNC